MSREFDVIVVGSGITGAAFAAALAASRLAPAPRIALIAERLPVGFDRDAALDLRVFALNRASQRLLQRAQIWSGLPAGRRFAYERMCVWDASDSPRSRAAVHFDCAEIGEPDLGSIVEARALQWQALEAARRAGVATFESTVEALDIGAADAVLRLRDHRRLRTALVVAADGAQSPLRSMRQIEQQGRSYEQRAIVAHVSTERAHEATAWQRFLPGGPLAFLPLGDSRSSIVWSVDAARADALLALAEADFEAALEEASGAFLGRCRLTSARAAFPLQLRFASEYVRPRFALIGDAAHCVHPLAGQGLNLGLSDCDALLRALGDANIEQYGELRVLRGYERARKAENLIAAAAFDGLNRLFSNANPALRGLRSFGLGAVERLGPLKRRLARGALGV